MATPLKRQLDAENRVPFINVAPGTAPGHVVVLEQLTAAVQGISWKDNVRARTTTNITLSAPGATLDGVAMNIGESFLADGQTTATEKGIYIWNGAAVPATRAPGSTTFDELESAVVTVDEGTSAGTTWRQTQVNGVIGTDALVFTAFGSSAAPASETTAGVAELATQAETDAGTDDARIVTPLKLATYAGRAKRFSAAIGDGSATSIAVTHNLGTRDVVVDVSEVGGLYRTVLCEVQKTSVNSITLLFDVAPTASALRVTVIA